MNEYIVYLWNGEYIACFADSEQDAINYVTLQQGIDNMDIQNVVKK